MRKKRIAGMLALVMCFSVLVSDSNAKAETFPSDSTNVIELEKISENEMIPETVDEIISNSKEHSYSGEDYSLNDEVKTYGETGDNTDPNYAYLVTNDSVIQGVIESAGEIRWYGFPVTEKSKVTVLLQMAESLDVDLYVFKLNEETRKLDLVGGSAREGTGLFEYYNSVLDIGTYYLAVGGYEGVGAFAFAFYQSTADVVYEINDSKETATSIVIDKEFVGVIDNPNDIDYYKVTVTSPTVMQYSITSSNGYSFLYGGSSGDTAAIYTINASSKTYEFMPGTYYFAALSESGNYSTSAPYTVKFKKIGNMVDNSSLNIIGISEDGGIVYQTDQTGSLNYVNGKRIDYSYSYYDEISNSAGTQYYDIKIDTNAGANVSLAKEYRPVAVHYVSSTRPAMNVSSRPALILTYFSDTDFYQIHCKGTGAYSSNTFWDETNWVRVLIDPETGDLIDIVEPNYYYHYAPQGNNSIYITSPYSMQFYNNWGDMNYED